MDPHEVYNIMLNVAKQIFAMAGHFQYYMTLMEVNIIHIILSFYLYIFFVQIMFRFLDVVEEDYAVKLTLAILGPVVGFCIIAGIVLFYLLVCRTRKKRTLAARRNKLVIDSEMESSILHFSFSSPTSTTYHSHELKATAAGDSTLKV